MATKFMLTTVDNPFNPFDDFVEWYKYDSQKGYNTCSYLGRITFTAEQLSDIENDEEIERAIDRIITNDFLNIYKKITSSEKIEAIQI